MLRSKTEEYKTIFKEIDKICSKIEIKNDKEISKKERLIYYTISISMLLVAIFYMGEQAFWESENIAELIFWAYCGGMLTLMSVLLIVVIRIKSGKEYSCKVKNIMQILLKLIVIGMFVAYIAYRAIKAIMFDDKEDAKDVLNMCFFVSFSFGVFTLYLVVLEMLLCSGMSFWMVVKGIKWLTVLSLVSLCLLYVLMTSEKGILLCNKLGVLVMDKSEEVLRINNLKDIMNKMYVFDLLLLYIIVSSSNHFGENLGNAIKDSITIITLFVLFSDKKREYKSRRKNEKSI